MILRLALRNILRHRTQSLLILLMLTLAAALFVLGNSMLARSGETLRGLFVDNVTGDLVVKAETDVSMSVYGANTPAIGELFSIPVIKQQEEIVAYLESRPDVRAFTPLVSGFAALDIAGRRYEVPLFGIFAEQYFAMFGDLRLQSGRRLRPGERGAMLTAQKVARIERESGTEVAIGDEILLSTFGRQGFRIRPVPLVGIYTYPVTLHLLQDTVLVDAETVQALNAILIPSVQESAINLSGVPDLGANVDDLFAADPLERVRIDGDDGSLSVSEVLDRVRRSADNGERADARGAATFLLVDLDSSRRTSAVREEIDAIARQYGAEAIDWREAAGSAAMLSLLLQYIFNGGFLIFVVALVLGVANIILISTFRRTREIATIRAIGAQAPHIRLLLYGETAILTIVSAGLAVGLAWLGAKVVNTANIEFQNSLIRGLIGGPTLSVNLSPKIVLLTLPALFSLGLLSTVYPVRRVLRVSLVQAIAKG